MTNPEKIAFKRRLKQAATDLIEERIKVAKLAIEQAQEAANQEEKSSAGDKYETGRAMSHLQKDMHARQLAENLKELSSLHAIPTDTLYNDVVPGAVIQAGPVCFFLSAGLGKLSIEGQIVIYLSPQAPLTRELLHKAAGDTFPFNRSEYLISQIF